VEERHIGVCAWTGSLAEGKPKSAPTEVLNAGIGEARVDCVY
jgi:hypothetical protein